MGSLIMQGLGQPACPEQLHHQPPCLPMISSASIALPRSVWHPQAYAALRSCTVAEAASALARAGRLAALPLLLQRHPHALLPSLLDVLACIPETVDAKQYAPLLRRVGGWVGG